MMDLGWVISVKLLQPVLAIFQLKYEYILISKTYYMLTFHDQVTDTLNQSRAFATVTVPSAGLPNIVTIANLSRQTRLMLASADGYFYIYNIPEEGGECIMVKQHRVDPECSYQAAGDQPGPTPPDSPAVIPVTQVSINNGFKY